MKFTVLRNIVGPQALALIAQFDHLIAVAIGRCIALGFVTYSTDQWHRYSTEDRTRAGRCHGTHRFWKTCGTHQGSVQSAKYRLNTGTLREDYNDHSLNDGERQGCFS